MRLALTFVKSEYENQTVVDIQAVEVVDSTRSDTTAAAMTEFTDPVSGTVYVKRCVDIPEAAYKKTILSNYSDPITGGCKYMKASNSITVLYTSPNNRNLGTLDRRYPLAADVFPWG